MPNGALYTPVPPSYSSSENFCIAKHPDGFDRSAYVRMMEDVESGKIGVCIMKDMTRILTRQEYCGDIVNFKTAHTAQEG